MTTPLPDDDYDQISGDFDDVERLTRAVKRVALAGLVASPLWILLLWLFGEVFGVGLFGLVLASLIASGAAWWWLIRRGGVGGARSPRASRGPGLGIPSVWIFVVAGILVLYLLFALWAASRGR